ncbi:hypothetical protein BJ138DRAFT_1128531, partial [Hygrophoropsis aurantiaca]
MSPQRQSQTPPRSSSPMEEPALRSKKYNLDRNLREISATSRSSPPLMSQALDFSPLEFLRPRKSRSLSPRPFIHSRRYNPYHNAGGTIKYHPYLNPRPQQSEPIAYHSTMKAIASGSSVGVSPTETNARFLAGLHGLSKAALHSAASVKRASYQVLRHEMLWTSWKLEEAERLISFYREVQKDNSNLMKEMVTENAAFDKRLTGDLGEHKPSSDNAALTEESAPNNSVLGKCLAGDLQSIPEEHKPFSDILVHGASQAAAVETQLHLMNSHAGSRGFSPLQLRPSSPANIVSSSSSDIHSDSDIVHLSSGYNLDEFPEDEDAPHTVQSTFQIPGYAINEGSAQTTTSEEHSHAASTSNSQHRRADQSATAKPKKKVHRAGQSATAKPKKKVHRAGQSATAKLKKKVSSVKSNKKAPKKRTTRPPKSRAKPGRNSGNNPSGNPESSQLGLEAEMPEDPNVSSNVFDDEEEEDEEDEEEEEDEASCSSVNAPYQQVLDHNSFNQPPVDTTSHQYGAGPPYHHRSTSHYQHDASASSYQHGDTSQYPQEASAPSNQYGAGTSSYQHGDTFHYPQDAGSASSNQYGAGT